MYTHQFPINFSGKYGSHTHTWTDTNTETQLDTVTPTDIVEQISDGQI